MEVFRPHASLSTRTKKSIKAIVRLSRQVVGKVCRKQQQYSPADASHPDEKDDKKSDDGVVRLISYRSLATESLLPPIPSTPVSPEEQRCSLPDAPRLEATSLTKRAREDLPVEWKFAVLERKLDAREAKVHQLRALNKELARRNQALAVEMSAERAHRRMLQKGLAEALKHGGCTHKFGCCACYFSPDKDVDFRSNDDDNRDYFRGGLPYHRPLGCMRYALKLSIRYDDSRWLNPRKGWIVAYHGTSFENAGSIIREGFHVDKCRRFSYGRGIYCSPDPDTARRYAPLYCENGITRQLIIQVRVHPRAYRIVKPASRRTGEYWLVEDPEDVRPYAICVYDIAVYNV